jgi:hypothetical protein
LVARVYSLNCVKTIIQLNLTQYGRREIQF